MNPVANTLNGQTGSETTAMFNGVWDFHRQDGSYRPQQDDVAPTVAAKYGTGGNNVPMVGVRRLTPTECARLQGFPDDWNSFLADANRYKQFGNAVCVNVAEWIGKRIMKAEKTT